MDMHSNLEDRKPPKQLTDARHAFNAYLTERPVAGHYLSVSSREAPLRRTDGDKVTALAQLAVIRDNFMWDDHRSRWTKKNGGTIVTEGKIYDVILSFQRVYRNVRDELFPRIHKDMVGVQLKDVLMAVDLWKEHHLGNLDVSDDTIWGGPTAVPDLKRSSAPAENNESVDPGYPTPGTGSPSDTRLESHPHSGLEEGANRVFHPIHPDRLHIGTCRDNGTDVWITLTRRTGSQAGALHPLFYDNAGKRYANKASANIIWREEFKRSQFAGIGHEQKRARHDYLYGIIQSQKGRSIPPPRSAGRISVSGHQPSNPASRMRVPAMQGLPDRAPIRHTRAGSRSEIKTGRQARRSTMAVSIPRSPPPAVNNKRRRNTDIIDLGEPSEDEGPVSPRLHKRPAVAGVSFVRSGSLNPEPSVTEPPNFPKFEAGHSPDPQSSTFEGISREAVARTSLLVSVEHQLNRAPANVPLEACQTVKQLFEILILECNLKGRAAIDLQAVSATYTWNKKQLLIRKGRPRDWTLFCEDIRKGWDREAGKFAEDGCEIKIMVHVDV